MRYNCNALYTLEEVAAQCRAAILKADQDRQDLEAIADLLFSDRICWEDDLLIAA